MASTTEKSGGHAIKRVRIEQMLMTFFRRAVHLRFHKGATYMAGNNPQAARTPGEKVVKEAQTRASIDEINQSVEECKLNDPEFIQVMLGEENICLFMLLGAKKLVVAVCFVSKSWASKSRCCVLKPRSLC